MMASYNRVATFADRHQGCRSKCAHIHQRLSRCAPRVVCERSLGSCYCVQDTAGLVRFGAQTPAQLVAGVERRRNALSQNISGMVSDAYKGSLQTPYILTSVESGLRTKHPGKPGPYRPLLRATEPVYRTNYPTYQSFTQAKPRSCNRGGKRVYRNALKDLLRAKLKAAHNQRVLEDRPKDLTRARDMWNLPERCNF